MRVTFASLALAVLLAPSSALAAEWSDYDDLFQTFPCPDGWVGCMIKGKRVSPEPSRVARMPVPSHARVDFLSLSATPVFDPFVGLSDYPIEPAKPEKVAVIAPVQRPVAETPAGPPMTEGMVVHEVEEREVVDEVPEVVEEIAEVVEVVEVVEEVPEVVEEVPEDVEEVAEVTEETDEGAEEVAQLRPVEEEKIEEGPGDGLVVADRGPVTCEDLRALEPSAMMGRLSVDQRSCLQASMDATKVQTEKKAVSLLLIQNAWTQDKTAWGKLVKQHLERIDQSDPNLCYKYAQHLYKRKSHASTIRWAEVALENKTRWSGETYTSRVYDLHKLKAAAQQAIWMAAEDAHKTAPSAETDAKRESARTATKVYARQWLDYARSASKDTTKAMMVCTSAAGTETYCE
ncbi:MAG: hypothetical protein KC912_13680 [Proteobacteria bacterium]|nr:hypothetical protein [Pseudomonadota bacterium]